VLIAPVSSLFLIKKQLMAYTSPYAGIYIASNIVLNLKSTQSPDGKTFALQENTGDYVALTNPAGFGTPNFARADMGPIVTSSGILMEVMLPGSTSWDYGLEVPITFINPGGTGNDIFTINPADIGYTVGSVFPDGVYTVRYIVEKNSGGTPLGFLQAVTKYVLLAHNAKCCVYSQLAKVTGCDCCEGDSVDDALYSYSLYKSMLYQAAAGNSENATNLLECVNDACTKCSSC